MEIKHITSQHSGSFELQIANEIKLLKMSGPYSKIEVQYSSASVGSQYGFNIIYSALIIATL